MKLSYQPAYVLLNLFTPETPHGESFTIHIPEWASSVAVDKDGKINVFGENSGPFLDDGLDWDTLGRWEEIADLEREVEDWRSLRFELDELDSEQRCGTVFEIRL